MSVAVIIVAAGRGRRLGGETPKQYLPLGEKTAFRRSIETFLGISAVRWVVPTIHPDDRTLCDDALAGMTDDRVLPAVNGGDTRAVSVRHGLERLIAVAPNSVLIHDAARPFVPGRVVLDVIAALETDEGATAALPVVDALWQSEDGLARASVPRDDLWRAQTPQGFAFAKILQAHQNHDGTGADDVAVAKENGLGVKLVMGSEKNYKITTMADYERAILDAKQIDALTLAKM